MVSDSDSDADLGFHISVSVCFVIAAVHLAHLDCVKSTTKENPDGFRYQGSDSLTSALALLLHWGKELQKFEFLGSIEEFRD